MNGRVHLLDSMRSEAYNKPTHDNSTRIRQCKGASQLEAKRVCKS